MSQRILIRGSLKTWKLYAPFVLAGIALVLMVIIEDIRESAAARTVFFLIAGGFVLLGALVAVVLTLRRQWLEITDEGFVLTGAGGARLACRDEEVTGMCAFDVPEYGGGELKGRTAHLTAWVGGPGEERRVAMAVRSDLEEENPLDALTGRLTEKLRERARADFQSGGSLVGDGWEFSREGLRARAGGSRPEMIPLTDIGAFGNSDNQFCVWKKGAERPAVRLSPDSRNMDVLRLLMEEFVEGEGEDAPVAGTLGRVLFERRISYWYLWLIGLVPLVLGGIFVRIAQEGTRPVVAYAISAVFFGLGAFFAYAAWRSRRASFSCHEHGVRNLGVFSDGELRYEEMSTFTYNAVRHFVNGVYQGTKLEMAFQPTAGAGKKRIAYSSMVQGDDDALDELRDAVAAGVAERMSEELTQNGRVCWLPNLHFLAEGLEYRPRGLMGGLKEAVSIPYGDIAGFNIEEGYLKVTTHDSEEPAVNENFGQPNFFPGLHLLAGILNPGEQEEGGEEAAEGEAAPEEERAEEPEGEEQEEEREVEPEGDDEDGGEYDEEEEEEEEEYEEDEEERG